MVGAVGMKSHRHDIRSRPAWPEWIAITAVVALAAFLRLHALDLVEFKLDEATAVDRARAVLLVPVLVCLAFQLNFSALALVGPVAVVLAYRAREVDWRMFVGGAGLACLLLGPWLGHEAAHGFVDVGRLWSEGRGDRGASPIGAGTNEAIRRTVN